MRGFIVGLLVALVCGYMLFGNPDITLRSSDGKWADSEIQSKGRNFDGVVWLFEGYKLKCAAPKAVLVRATPELWYNIFAWPSYVSNPKWRVPYSNAHPELGDYYPSANVTSCSNDGLSPEMTKASDANSARHLKNLREGKFGH